MKSDMEKLHEEYKFFRSFENTYIQFMERYERFKELDRITDALDWNTYFDILLVSIRAICLENKKLKGNLTMCNFFNKVGRDDISQRLEEYLQRPIADDGDGRSLYRVKKGDQYIDFTIWEAIKYVTDKIICHTDVGYDDSQAIVAVNALTWGNAIEQIIEDIMLICMGKEPSRFGLKDYGYEKI